MALVEWFIDEASKAGNMESWRVMKVDSVDTRTCRSMDAKVECGRTCDRVAKIWKVSINHGEIPSDERDRAFESIHKCHIAFRMNMNEKHAKRPLNMECPNDDKLDLPKIKLRVAVKKPMRVQPIAMNCGSGCRCLNAL